MNSSKARILGVVVMVALFINKVNIMSESYYIYYSLNDIVNLHLPVYIIVSVAIVKLVNFISPIISPFYLMM